MTETNCCPVMDLQWTQRVIDDQWADVYFCASCGHVHNAEKYAVPIRFPYNTRCVNCTGDLRSTAPGNQYPTSDQIRCTRCGLTATEDKALHDRFAALHPDHQYLAASEALADLGRHVLALKLATAETRWGQEPIGGEVQRLALLEAMNHPDRALDEAYEWADNEGSPNEVQGVIATLEAGQGNLRGAMAALERGLNVEPDRADWWCDYAEIMVHLDDRPGAVRAAAHVIKLQDLEFKDRAVAVIAEMGERFYAGGQFAEALGACSLLGEDQERYAKITWLRARISAVNQDTEYLVKWLEATLALEPTHQEAEAMLEPYRKKTGWFSW